MLDEMRLTCKHFRMMNYGEKEEPLRVSAFWGRQPKWQTTLRFFLNDLEWAISVESPYCISTNSCSF